ncbi:MAG: hypothetical protein A2Z83_02045 [Omnitrophica bacterium GWA2_52_8]|nr:MAG: hypothetical protein A2Z83_02045 [Omnitrophica bacterium GWA2_52_8]
MNGFICLRGRPREGTGMSARYLGGSDVRCGGNALSHLLRAVTAGAFFTYALLCLIAFGACAEASPKRSALRHVQRWMILLDYNAALELEVRQSGAYDLVILDADNHPPLDIFPPETVKIAYVSVGEAESYRGYWEKIKTEAFVLDENENWKENYYVDVRSAEWSAVLLRKVIPEVLQQGFDGIFMDTLDTAGLLEWRDSGKYAGSRTAMVRLVLEIHKMYPELLLISNNGYDILPEIAPVLSGILVEDLFSGIDFENGGYRAVSEADRKERVDILLRLGGGGKIPVFTVDYADIHNRGQIREIREKSKKLGFRPYLAQGSLSAVYEQDDLP